MKNYIISDQTIALLKKENITIIYDVENEQVINKNIRSILENNCLLHGSNMEGRLKSAKKILNIKYKVPLIISEAENIILLQIDCLRNKECLFIVANKIVDYEINANKLIIKCINNHNFTVNISKYSFEKMLIYTIKLNNFLKWLKNVNIV